jgi:hypothetical protein
VLGSAAGSEIGFQSTKNSTLTTYTSTIGANGSTFINDSFTMNNTLGGSMFSVNSSGDLTVNGDITVSGGDIKSSGGTTVMTLSNNDLTVAGDISTTGGRFSVTESTNLLRVNIDNIEFYKTNTTQKLMDIDALNSWNFFNDKYLFNYFNGNALASLDGTTNTAKFNFNTFTVWDTANANNNLSLDSSGNLTIRGDLRVNGGDIQNPGGTAAITLTSANATTTIRGDSIALKVNAGTAATSANVDYTRTFGEFAYTNAAGFAIAAQNTIYTMPLDTTLNNSGVTIANTGDININVAGWYKIIISLQVTLTVSNQPGQIDFWLRKNGADVANSKTQVDLLKDQKAVIAMDWLVNSDGNDYWEIVYVGTSANYADIDFPTIAATTTPYVSPVAPALIVNVIPAGM